MHFPLGSVFIRIENVHQYLIRPSCTRRRRRRRRRREIAILFPIRAYNSGVRHEPSDGGRCDVLSKFENIVLLLFSVTQCVLLSYYKTDGGAANGGEGKTIFPDNISILTIVNIVRYYHIIIIIVILYSRATFTPRATTRYYYY